MIYAARRLDKKCGASGIAANNKCSKPTSSAKQSAAKQRENNRKILNTIGAVTAVGLVGLQAGLVARDIRAYNRRASAFREQAARAQAGASYARARQQQYKQRSANFNQAYEEWQRRRSNQRWNYAGAAARPTKAYETLGVNPKATLEEIKRAYKAAARKNHPDLGGDAEKMKAVNNAYDEIIREREATGRKDSIFADLRYNLAWDLGPEWDWARRWKP